VKPVKRILTALRLDKIAAVDFPCQGPALAAIMKRADPEPVAKADLTPSADPQVNGQRIAKSLGSILRKFGLPISESDEDEGAETFAETLGEQLLTQAFWSAYYSGTQALEGALLSILKDDTVADKKPLIDESIQQFAAYIEQIMPGDIGKSLAAGIAATAGQPGNLLEKGVPMSDAIKKALGLSADATETDMAKSLSTLVDNAALGALTSIEKAFVERPDLKMDATACIAFAKMTAAERKAQMDKAPKMDKEPDEDDMKKALSRGDALQAGDGTIVLKSVVGDGVFAILKGQADQLAKNAEELRKSNDILVESDFAKRAKDIGMEAGFGSIMRKAYAGDAAAQAEMEKRFTALTAQVDASEMFKSLGHNGPVADSAEGELMAKVAELQKSNPALSDAQAFTRVYTARENKDIKKRYDQERLAVA
jgi:hypothetical protein